MPMFAQGTATTGIDDLKNLAVGRLFLDNFDHVKSHWIMVTPALSQLALHFGVNDLEGTVVREKIYHEAGAHTAQALVGDRLVVVHDVTPVVLGALGRIDDGQRAERIRPVGEPERLAQHHHEPGDACQRERLQQEHRLREHDFGARPPLVLRRSLSTGVLALALVPVLQSLPGSPW